MAVLGAAGADLGLYQFKTAPMELHELYALMERIPRNPAVEGACPNSLMSTSASRGPRYPPAGAHPKDPQIEESFIRSDRCCPPNIYLDKKEELPENSSNSASYAIAH